MLAARAEGGRQGLAGMWHRRVFSICFFFEGEATSPYFIILYPILTALNLIVLYNFYCSISPEVIIGFRVDIHVFISSES